MGAVSRTTARKRLGYTDDGESVSMRVQCADVKKFLCSVHKMNLGGNVVVLDGARSYMQHKENGQKTRINYEEGQYVMYLWLPSKGEVVQAESTEGQSFCDLGRRKRASFQSASLSAVSPHEDKGKEGDVMEEEFRRVFGESSKEVVEREIGEEAVRARARKTETVPSQREVDEHNLDHGVFRSRCRHCVKGRAESYGHVKKVQNEGDVPTIGIDYMYMHSEQEKEEEKGMPIAVAKDKDDHGESGGERRVG